MTLLTKSIHGVFLLSFLPNWCFYSQSNVNHRDWAESQFHNTITKKHKTLLKRKNTNMIRIPPPFSSSTSMAHTNNQELQENQVRIWTRERNRKGKERRWERKEVFPFVKTHCICLVGTWCLGFWTTLMHTAWHDASSSLIVGTVLLPVIFSGPPRCFSSVLHS